jgi:hypothetical protein
MAQRRGERTTAQNQRDFPHIVEMSVPPSGFGVRLDSMYQFLRERNIEARRGRGQRRDDRDFIRWCFANRPDAEDFAKSFGGRFICGA